MKVIDARDYETVIQMGSVREEGASSRSTTAHASSQSRDAQSSQSNDSGSESGSVGTFRTGFNVSKAVLGYGILTIPMVFAEVSLGCGIFLLALCAAMSYLSSLSLCYLSHYTPLLLPFLLFSELPSSVSGSVRAANHRQSPQQSGLRYSICAGRASVETVGTCESSELMPAEDEREEDMSEERTTEEQRVNEIKESNHRDFSLLRSRAKRGKSSLLKFNQLKRRLPASKGPPTKCESWNMIWRHLFDSHYHITRGMRVYIDDIDDDHRTAVSSSDHHSNTRNREIILPHSMEFVADVMKANESKYNDNDDRMDHPSHSQSTQMITEEMNSLNENSLLEWRNGKILDLYLCVYTLLSCIIYVMISTANVCNVIRSSVSRFDHNDDDAHSSGVYYRHLEPNLRYYVLGVIFALGMAPLNWIPLRHVSILSGIGIVAVLFQVLCVALVSKPEHHSQSSNDHSRAKREGSFVWLAFDAGSIMGSMGVFCCLLSYHFTVPRFYTSMRDSNVRRYGQVSGVSFTFVFAVLAAMGILAYVKYGRVLVDFPNILDYFAGDEGSENSASDLEFAIVQTARVLMSLSVLVNQSFQMRAFSVCLLNVLNSRLALLDPRQDNDECSGPGGIAKPSSNLRIVGDTDLSWADTTSSVATSTTSTTKMSTDNSASLVSVGYVTVDGCCSSSSNKNSSKGVSNIRNQSKKTSMDHSSFPLESDSFSQCGLPNNSKSGDVMRKDKPNSGARKTNSMEMKVLRVTLTLLFCVIPCVWLESMKPVIKLHGYVSVSSFVYTFPGIMTLRLAYLHWLFNRTEFYFLSPSPIATPPNHRILRVPNAKERRPFARFLALGLCLLIFGLCSTSLGFYAFFKKREYSQF